jgi:hypothetical protein
MTESSPRIPQARILNLARIIWAAVFLSILALVAVAFIKSGNLSSRSPDTIPANVAPISIFGPIAFLMGGLSIIVPMVLRRLSTGKPITQNSLIPFILGPALTEPVAILGFVRVMSGAPIEEFYPFVGGAVVLMLFHFPRDK